MSKYKKTLTTIIAFIITYCLHFIVFPMIAERYYPTSNEASGLYFGSFILLILLLEFKVCSSIIEWVIGDIIYFALVLIYHGEGYYGIGLVSFIDLDGTATHYDFGFAVVSILVIAVEIIILELIMKGISLFIKKLYHKFSGKRL